MKLIYTSDLHGDQYLYDELVEIIAREKDADALLLGEIYLPIPGKSPISCNI
ncbi:hypothetical protein [Labilibaculum antarcticum]|uniref:hypothetical protein n=1 Tax=Labilibaculum antarcticum TaxID=1717717 RepID=UPI0012940610|nr:hypothetical protein [Labilibaculum antarcticum]